MFKIKMKNKVLSKLIKLVNKRDIYGLLEMLANLKNNEHYDEYITILHILIFYQTEYKITIQCAYPYINMLPNIKIDNIVKFMLNVKYLSIYFIIDNNNNIKTFDNEKYYVDFENHLILINKNQCSIKIN